MRVYVLRKGGYVWKVESCKEFSQNFCIHPVANWEHRIPIPHCKTPIRKFVWIVKHHFYLFTFCISFLEIDGFFSLMIAKDINSCSFHIITNIRYKIFPCIFSLIRIKSQSSEKKFFERRISLIGNICCYISPLTDLKRQ